MIWSWCSIRGHVIIQNGSTTCDAISCGLLNMKWYDIPPPPKLLGEGPWSEDGAVTYYYYYY